MCCFYFITAGGGGVQREARFSGIIAVFLGGCAPPWFQAREGLRQIRTAPDIPMSPGRQMGQVGLSHLPGLICMTQKDLPPEIFPLPGTKAPGAPDDQEHARIPENQEVME